MRTGDAVSRLLAWQKKRPGRSFEIHSPVRSNGTWMVYLLGSARDGYGPRQGRTMVIAIADALREQR